MKKIFSEVTLWKGKEYHCDYLDIQNFSNLNPVTQVQAICTDSVNPEIFYIYENIEGDYGLAGGTVENGEELEAALVRELSEEMSCRVVDFKPLMALKITEDGGAKVTYQVRYWASVKPFSDKVMDPDGKSIERVAVSKHELSNYITWGRKLREYIKKYEESI